MSLRTLHHCQGPQNRRFWLKVGGLSLGAFTTGAAPNLARLLAAESSSQQTREVDSDFSVILFWANGGPSHLDLFDLKPEAPTEYRGPFRPIATNVSGVEITEELPLLAGMADRFTLVRSLHHERGEHSGGTNRFLTGHASIAANLADSEFPDIGSVISKRLGNRVPDVPPFIANTKAYGSGPAYLGPAFAPFMPTPNPVSSSGNNEYDPVPIYRSEGESDAADTLNLDEAGVLTLRRRQNLLSALDVLPRRIDQSGTIPAVDTFQRQAVEMLAGTRMRSAFDLSQENDSTRRRYGETHWGKSLLTCRRLVEAGARFVQCQATFRLSPEIGRTSNWDDHSVNSDIFKAYREKLPSFDQSVSAIVEDIYRRGLDRKVLFVFCGEFGRTPRIAHQDSSGRPGRDHWPRAMSVFLAGGGFHMGQVIGATNAKAEEPVARIMNSNCLLASIYERFGIDTSGTFPNTAGRPIHILPEGRPIRELF
ncbi:MAG: DUF1501 domain-containing protein [Planctomycetota bacterium]|nr:DUF1501 domain-containing protein [Planctomycetota bacterium]MDA1250792.1 DUF1501 domain-containing protein [Planctomycetota bacterium]